MRIGVISDIHDNVWNLWRALERLQDTEAVICCGDLCSPFVVAQLADGLKGKPLHAVFGNNDGDLFRITGAAGRYGEKVQLHGEFAELRLAERLIAVSHYPAIALPLADSGRYDVVCYGHDHTFDIGTRGGTTTINPGAIMGFDPTAGRDIPATLVVFDTETQRAERVEL